MFHSTSRPCSTIQTTLKLPTSRHYLLNQRRPVGDTTHPFLPHSAMLRRFMRAPREGTLSDVTSAPPFSYGVLQRLTPEVFLETFSRRRRNILRETIVECLREVNAYPRFKHPKLSQGSKILSLVKTLPYHGSWEPDFPC